MDETVEFETEPTVDQPEAEPVAEVEETPPGTPAEEFDEIVYNGVTTKIPVTERKTYLQKGYNYDKVTEKLKAREAELAEYQRREAELAALYGTDTKDLRRQLIATRAEEQGITPEALEKQLALQQEVENLRRVTREAQLTTEKAKLRDKPFFAELEAEIDALLPTSEHWTVQNAYEYLRGKNFEKLTAQAKTSTQKSTIADIQDQARRGITQPGAKAPAGKPLSPEVRKIAQAMGVKI